MTSETELHIVRAIIRAKAPQRAHWIAKRIGGANDSLVNYHLPRMVAKGILVADDKKGVVYYDVQPILREKYLDEFSDHLSLFIFKHRDKIMYFEKPTETVVNILSFMTDLVGKKISKKKGVLGEED